ncbi:tetraspanin family domain-containing protein [Phthorimaea operculella]|nr:tetraspanin family domain-containing protein [Phthorimaea operculella]
MDVSFRGQVEGVRDDQSSRPRTIWENMGNSPSGKHHAGSHFVKMGLHRRAADELEGEENALRNLPSKLKESSCCTCKGCFKLIFVILAIIIVIKSLALIALSVSTAIATKIYGAEQSGRLVSMIILAVTAATTLSAVIYATVAVFKQKIKALHAISIVLIVLILIQSIIAGVAVKVTAADETNLNLSLMESFQLARDGNPREKNIWATTQNDLTCCGVYSPEDYRRPGSPAYFPPDVPISCCPSYDPDRSELVQERGREICRSRSDYYHVGCKGYVLQVFKETATYVLSVTVALILLQVVQVILGWILCHKFKKEAEENQNQDPENLKTEEPPNPTPPVNTDKNQKK